MSAMKIYFMLILLLSVQCRGRSLSNLDHVDDPAKRGAENAAPWHFHTGRGYSISEIKDSSTGEVRRILSHCDLNLVTPDSNCMEEVFFFDFNQISLAVDKARQTYENLFYQYTKTGAAYTALSVGIVVTTVKGVVAAQAVVGAGQFAGAVTGVVGGLAASGFAIAAYFEGKSALEARNNMYAVQELIAEQIQFVNRCQHVSKDFLQRARDLGVMIIFPQKGEYIPATDYLNSVREEEALYQRTLDYAVKNNRTANQAYNEFFLKQCGQLPIDGVGPVNDAFMEKWKFIPQSIAAEAISASKVINLRSGNMIEFANFDSNDFSSQGEKNAMMKALGNIETWFRKIDMGSSSADKAKLEAFRRDYKSIYIVPRWGRANAPYEVTERIEGKVLYIHALWWAFYNYQIDLRGFFKDKLGINPDTYGIR